MGWVPHEAHSETRIQGQVVYSGDDSRRHSREDGKGDTERKMANKGHVTSESLLWASGSQHPQGALGGCGELASHYLSGRRGSWDTRIPTPIRHWVGLFLETNSLGLPGHPACWPGVLPQPEQSPYSGSHKCSNEHPCVYRAEY